MVGTETLSSVVALIPPIIGLTIHDQAKASKLIMLRKIRIILEIVKFDIKLSVNLKLQSVKRLILPL